MSVRILRKYKDIVDRVPEKSCDLQDELRTERIDQRIGSAADNKEGLTGAFRDAQRQRDEGTTKNCEGQLQMLRYALRRRRRSPGTRGQP